jgi:hypothetical protein
MAFVIDRAVVESQDVDAALAVLATLCASADDARANRNCMQLVVSGYETDPRALWQVPEVRAYLRSLTRRWPYWLHFVSKIDDSLSILLLCLMDPAAPKRPLELPGNVGSPVDPDALRATMLRLFAGVDALYERLGLTEQENEQLTGEVLDCVIASFGDA